MLDLSLPQQDQEKDEAASVETEGFTKLVTLYGRYDENGEMEVTGNFHKAFERTVQWAPPLASFLGAFTAKANPELSALQQQSVIISTIVAMADAYDIQGFHDTLGISEAHPGSLTMPQVVRDDGSAKQVLSIWQFPELEDCDNCGHDHEPEFFLHGQQIENLTPDEIGRLLSEAVHMYSHYASKGDERTKLIRAAEVQKAFHDHLNRDLPQA
jgi:hypothetical protein